MPNQRSLQHTIPFHPIYIYCIIFIHVDKQAEQLTVENYQTSWLTYVKNNFWEKARNHTLSWPESPTRKFRGVVTSMTPEVDSKLVPFDEYKLFKIVSLPYSAFIITSPPVSNCLFLFLLATFCCNFWAFSAAALASWTCTIGEAEEGGVKLTQYYSPKTDLICLLWKTCNF